ncbi:helix-turn-helix transcriptional regulator [Mangrovitalea sediminis]|uniref:helix-turn-helix transcriptional regulator n=1 Tax=Mangrovitalea sediminis TaxID=1982043 RepID=UPI000BE56A04|nr:WYL domain-containing protein [Mangrovitalea sediminis]
MKKTDWPIRWDLLLRYRLIEIIAFWEGRLTTNHICHAFGIGRQQASKDINTYLREIGPENLDYDRHLKGYVPTAAFTPRVTLGSADEYLDLMMRDDALSRTFDSLDVGLPGSEVLRAPVRNVRAEVVRPIVRATRQGRRLEARYVSMGDPAGDTLTIEPHSLVYSGQRWHVRAWCEKNADYRDFVISRFRGEPQILESKSRHKQSQDTLWNTPVRIIVRPDQRLSPDQQMIIAEDYGMAERQLELQTRAALLRYLLQLMNLEPQKAAADPLAQQVEIANLDELRPWL